MADEAEPASWTEHTSSSGRTFYYDRLSGTSTWTRPPNFAAPSAIDTPSALRDCLAHPVVARLVGQILTHCGVDALPTVSRMPADDAFCEGGRGGAFCCAASRIYLCEKAWVGCGEVAYELTHALNLCRGFTNCRRHGVRVDGVDCGYLSPPDVACSELRAASLTGRCARHKGAAHERCLAWHARWAVASCYPDDEHLELHVRHAQAQCRPTPDETG